MPRLLEQVRAVIRLKHYSIRTEEAYIIRRFIIYHRKQHPKRWGRSAASQATSLIVNSSPSTTCKGNPLATRNKIHSCKTSANSSRHASSIVAMAKIPSLPFHLLQ
jgi:hypothetical protein